MRPLAIALAMLATALLPTAALAASCTLKVADVVSTSPYFAGNMRLAEAITDTSLSLIHNDDPRMAIIFTMGAPESVSGRSRSEYVTQMEDRAQELAIRNRTAGRQAEHAVFPYDPVGWRTLLEQKVVGIGDAMVAHQEVRITPDCLLVADVVAPNLVNLRSRMIGMVQAVAGIRDTAARYVVPEAWAPERTVPTGGKALGVGVAVPLLIVAILFALMKQMVNLDPPGSTVRIVQASAASISLGAAFVMRQAYFDGLPDLKYVDGGILLTLVALACLVGSLGGQRGTLVGLLSVLVGGLSIGLATFLGWTPDRFVTAVVAGSLLIVGLSGFYAWSEASSSARLRRAMESKKTPVTASARPA